jgi:hypothetical protein
VGCVCAAVVNAKGGTGGLADSCNCILQGEGSLVAMECFLAACVKLNPGDG